MKRLLSKIFLKPGELYVPVWKFDTLPELDFIIGFIKFNKSTNKWCPKGWTLEYDDVFKAIYDYYIWWLSLRKKPSYGRILKPLMMNKCEVD